MDDQKAANLDMWMDEARQIAAQCWCDPATEDRVMDPALAEVVARHIARWMDTAAQNERNTAYYRGLLDECAKHLGPAVYTADDGSLYDSPVRAKIPELVAQLSGSLSEGGETTV